MSHLSRKVGVFLGMNDLVSILLPSLLIAILPGMLSLAGDSLARWDARLRARDHRRGLAYHVASGMLGMTGSDDPEAMKRIEKLSRFISAIAPLLTFVAAIVGAYLSYLSKPK